jgi:quinol monooxygenase YgiN
VIVTATRISVRPEKRTELDQTIGGLVEDMNETRPNVMFRHYVDAADENSYLLLAEWDSEAALDEYLRSDEFAVLRGAIGLLSTRSVDFTAVITSQAIRR